MQFNSKRSKQQEHLHYLCGQRGLDMHMSQHSTCSQDKVRFNSLLIVSIFLSVGAFLIGVVPHPLPIKISVMGACFFFLLDCALGREEGEGGGERGRAHSLASRFGKADFQSNFGYFTTPSLKGEK